MANIDETTALGGQPRAGRSLLFWLAVGLAGLLVLGGGAAGALHFFAPSLLGGSKAQASEAPLPFFLELKPIVVSIAGGSGSHFVQLGVSLELPAATAGESVTAVLPRLQDAMRQTMLTMKAEELKTPDGINKLRGQMIVQLNEVLLRVLGAERIAKINGGKADPALIQNLFFPTLVIE